MEENIILNCIKKILKLIFDKNNKIVGIAGSSSETNTELQNNITIQQLHNIVEAVPGCIYRKDMQGVYLGINESVVKVSGRYSKVGKNIRKGIYANHCANRPWR